MTTDTRTNEPTPEQVDVAAKAMWNLRKRASDPDWDGGELDHGVKEIYRQDARAALVAAQGAAPQAERDWRLDVVPEPWTDPAPVLLSSGVDEDALARLLCEKNYLSPDGKPTCAACRDKAHEVAAWLRGQGR